RRVCLTMLRCVPSRIWLCFFFSSRRRHTRSKRDWSSDVCSSDLFGQNANLRQLLDLILQQVVHAHRSQVEGFLELGLGHSDLIQIGRASCRERVYISDGGLAGEKQDVHRTGTQHTIISREQTT